jgi:ADP-ribose pyrophosphatase YjhB (NUDIX family)
MATKFEVSAGGIVYDQGKLLVIKTTNLQQKTVWTFPKGHIEKGLNETAEQAALREVEEETGYRCEIIKPIQTVKYWFKEKGFLINKTVHWYLMNPIEKTADTPSGTSHRDTGKLEVEETKWLDPEQATEMLSYKSDKEMVQKWILNR